MHADYKLPGDDGRWFLCYLDDASRFVTAYGTFEHPTTENALSVLKQAMKNHGKPASIMTDYGSQFYANAAKAKRRGVSDFEKRLVKLGIKQILAGLRHPQTNGKLERFHGEIQRKLPEFVNIMQRVSDPIDLFMEWYNMKRSRMSLDLDTWRHQYECLQKRCQNLKQQLLMSRQERNIMWNTGILLLGYHI